MFERQHLDRPTSRRPWLARLVNLFRVPFPEQAGPSPSTASTVCETVITEEPISEQFCTHSRVARWLRTAGNRLRRQSQAGPQTGGVCPVCGLLLPDMAQRESVLTVWFHDGGIYTHRYASHDPDDCYRIAENALHINLKDSVLTYSLELVSAVHFERRRIPPVAPEVLAAERIIAGLHRPD